MTTTRSLTWRPVAVLAVLSLVLAACGSSGKSGSGTSNTGSTTTVEVPTGGTLTAAAEEEPDCMDWLGSCAGNIWGFWIAQQFTVPSVFISAGTDGNLSLVPGPVVTGAPTMVTTPVQTITYNITPTAQWSDKVPITCADFVYTVDQEQNGTDIYDKTGWTDIATVTCPQGQNGKQVVVKYKPGTSYAGWQQLFSSTFGIYPSHILKGKDRDAAMKNGYSWSGGPWLMKWNKGQSVVLERNPNYWGPKTKLDKVVFKFITDTTAEFEAYQHHEVDAIYPQPQTNVIKGISDGLPDSNTHVNAQTATVEALFINNAKFPFDSVPVRKALGYAIDRDAIVKALFGKLGVDKAVNSINPYVLKDYSDQQAFANYHLDLDQVDKLMTDAGWQKNGNKIWEKDGKTATFTVNTNSDNSRRETMETVLQQQLKSAGFEMKIQNMSADLLFGASLLPPGKFQIFIAGQSVTALIPGLCSVFCTENIPTAANDFSGNNWTRTAIPELDKQLKIVDNSLDDNARQAAGKQGDVITADNQISLPIDPLPDISIWRKTVVGPISDNAIMGMFWNIDRWGVTS